MKKQILYSLLLLGICCVQLPALAGTDGTTESVNVKCDKNGCKWSEALKDPLKDGGKTVKYKTPDKTYKNATDAMGDTQYSKSGGMGDNTKTE